MESIKQARRGEHTKSKACVVIEYINLNTFKDGGKHAAINNFKTHIFSKQNLLQTFAAQVNWRWKELPKSLESGAITPHSSSTICFKSSGLILFVSFGEIAV